MIHAIGIDSVQIARFAHWNSYSFVQLNRIFSSAEIEYCLASKQKSAERFAARFAAREALWKALCQAWPEHRLPFLLLCRLVQVQNGPRGVPAFQVDPKISSYFPEYAQATILLSLTHSDNAATALTVISSL